MQAKLYLSTKEVKARYGISSSGTLHNWRNKKGFPQPISGRYYPLEQLVKWEKQQSYIT